MADSQKTLILTEKPSVARDFAGALGVKSRRQGFLEGKDFVITWAVGHLLELSEPADYEEKWQRWDLRTLPILPDPVTYKPIEQVADQLQVIQLLLKREDVARIVIATDAGREGELIARTILGTVPDRRVEIFRFWTSQALTPEVVSATLKNLKPASDFDRLWEAGKARQVADWLVGMNFSRAATLKCRGLSRETYSVGRVQTAVLALLVDRKEEREHFKPEPYWILRALFSQEKGFWWGNWFKDDEVRFGKQEDAERVAAVISDQWGEVVSVKKSRKSQPPPFLYSLTDLQRDANVRLGLSAKETLDLAQKLYEDRKCLSYPRTDARVLGTQTVALAGRILENLATSYPDLFQGADRRLVSSSNKRVFDDSKLTDHHALIPLAPLPQGVSKGEGLVYDLVLRRFAAAFHPKFEYEATEVITEVCGETFRTRGTRPLVLGWKAVYQNPGDESSEPAEGEDEGEAENLPPLKKKDAGRVMETRVQHKSTQPPPEYTEALLLKDMTNPSRHVSEEELQKIFKGEVGLGTQATRAQIIETLLKRRYIVRQNKKILPTDKGCALVHYLRNFAVAGQVTLPRETARWEQDLEKIARGEGSVKTFLADVKRLVVDGIREFQKEEPMGTPGMDHLGACPSCGGKIIEGRKGYGCSNWRTTDGGCTFVIWKDAWGRTLQPGWIRRLLKEKVLPPLVFRSGEGQKFFAVLKLEKDQTTGVWELHREEDKTLPARRGKNAKAPEPPPLGLCPRCGGDVVEGEKGYGCSRWRNTDGGCRFVIWKTISGRAIEREEAEELLLGGVTPTLHGFVSRKGRAFSACLKLDERDGGVIFSF